MGTVKSENTEKMLKVTKKHGNCRMSNLKWEQKRAVEYGNRSLSLKSCREKQKPRKMVITVVAKDHMIEVKTYKTSLLHSILRFS